MFITAIIGYACLSLIVLILFVLSIVSSVITGHYYISILKIAVTFFLVYELYNEWSAYLKKKKSVMKGKTLSHDDVYIFLALMSGALFTYFLNHDLGLGAVIASGIIGLFGATMVKKYQVPLYCGSFAGMVSASIITSYWGILIVGIFAGILFIVSKDVFKGFGGKLGAMAFFGTTISAVFLGTISSTMIASEVSVDIWLIVYFIIGALGTFILRDKFNLSAVFASALLGLTAALMLPLIHVGYGAHLAVGLFCGTFVGMSAIERIHHIKYVLLASILGAIVFTYTQSYFIGLGGKLGAIAFGSGIAAAGFANFIDKIKTSKKNPK